MLRPEGGGGGPAGAGQGRLPEMACGGGGSWSKRQKASGRAFAGRGSLGGEDEPRRLCRPAAAALVREGSDPEREGQILVPPVRPHGVATYDHHQLPYLEE